MFCLENSISFLCDHVDVSCFHSVNGVRGLFKCKRRIQEICVVSHLFPDHLFLCVCICVTCYVSQDGFTPLHISAANGCKDVAAVLLLCGAKMNAATKVVVDK